MNTTTTETMTRAEMICELATIQNRHEHQDITTITAFMSDEQVRRHLDRYRTIEKG